MRFQAAVAFATVLAGVAIPHEAGDAQVLIEPRRVLVLTSLESWVAQTRNIHLNVFYDDV